MFDDAADWWCDLLMCCCSVFHTYSTQKWSYTICDLLTHMQATEYRIQIHSPIHSTHFGFFTAHFDGRFSFSCVAHRQTTNVRRWWRSVNFMPQRAKKENVFDLQRVTWNRRTEIWRIEHHLSPVSTVLCWLCLGFYAENVPLVKMTIVMKYMSLREFCAACIRSTVCVCVLSDLSNIFSLGIYKHSFNLYTIVLNNFVQKIRSGLKSSE